MAEQQINLAFDTSLAPAPAAPPELRDEIAQAWGLPLGARVEISFRGGQLDAIAGVLELLSTPDYPWNPRQLLQLRIAGFTFTSRDIERWTRV
jgi:hypothetical protein